MSDEKVVASSPSAATRTPSTRSRERRFGLFSKSSPVRWMVSARIGETPPDAGADMTPPSTTANEVSASCERS